ncbi:MAG: Holliday junction branch migration protein RuvA [Bacillota bacterium]
MIAFISGTLVSKSNGIAIIDTNGIGYEMAISATTATDLPVIGEVAKLHTYMIVREDAVSLCGFSSLKEKNMFMKLITISGIGPKAAMCILSGMQLTELAIAIVTEDSKSIAKIKGIGKKTAERIILELKEKIATDDLAEQEKGSKKGKVVATINEFEDLDQDSIDAINVLRSMGMSKQDAQNAVVAVKPTSNCIEDLITNALKSFA